MGCFLGASEFGGITLRASLERNGSAFSVGGVNSAGVWNWVSAFNDFSGPAFVSRVSPTLQYNGTDLMIATNATMSSVGPPNLTCALFARKLDGRNADHNIACNLRGASIGAGMTPQDFAKESALWHRFNAALGRKVP